MMKRGPLNRITGTQIHTKPPRDDYHPATVIWLRYELGHQLTTAERVDLERYLFLQMFRLQ
jgi:hypothetical protein